MEKGRGVRKQVVQVKGDGGLNWGGRDRKVDRFEANF